MRSSSLPGARGSRASTHSHRVRCIPDIRQGIGPIGGLHAGALAAQGDLIFVSACDMPCIETAVVSYLFDTIGDADAAIPRWNNDMLEPLHAVYRRSVLLGYLESHASLSLRPMIRSLRTRYVPARNCAGSIRHCGPSPISTNWKNSTGSMPMIRKNPYKPIYGNQRNIRTVERNNLLYKYMQ